MEFRKDINGLRAIAVIAVVLFHFNASWMPGGFAGVDVFFVISGFLMTGIIFRGIEQENFSILKFYIARANRIVPALAALCLVLIVFGFFYLSPLDYRALGKHVASSIGFLSNIIYWRESGYFDAASHEKWLLHTWSLSVEWQFYIIYPLALVAMRRFMSVKTIKLFILIATILGFIFCVVATYWKPNASYYLLPTRAWEMLIGGVAYLYPFTIEQKRKRFIEWIGLTLIIGSYLLISTNTPWPGYLAIFPVLGTFLIIQAQRKDSFITGNVVFQKLGAWSYSIYLWHWPIVVAINYYSLNDNFVYFGIVLSIVLGFFSNQFIETIKYRKDFSLFKINTVHVSIVIILLGLFVYKNISLIFNIPTHIFNRMLVDKNMDDNGTYTWSKHFQLDNKITFKENSLKILIIGDSQAGDFINMLYETGVKNNVDILSRRVEAVCGAFNLNNKTVDELLQKQKLNRDTFNDCKQSISRLTNSDAIAEADIIIFAMLWRLENITYILESISNVSIENPKAKLYLVGPKKFSQTIPSMLYDAHVEGVDINNYAFNKILSGNQQLNDTFEANKEEYNYKYINMTDIICENQRCMVSNINDGLYYYDTTHTTMAGNKYLGEKLKSSKNLPLSIFSE